MTGYDIYKRAINLLGYSENGKSIVLNDSIFDRSLDLINQIAEDISIPKIASLSENLTIETKSLQALCYGTAMLIAISEGDSAKGSMFSQVYNAKRAAALNRISTVEDCLPTVSNGAD